MNQQTKVKSTEIGMIPQDWIVSSLGEAVEIKGRIGWRGYTINDLRESGPFVIGGKQIVNNKLDLSKPTHISEEKFEESPEIKIKKFDIILTKTGSIGDVAIIDKEIGKATINPNVALLKHKEKFDPYFLYYWLITPFSHEFIINGNTSSVQPAINQATLKTLPIPVPSFLEQKKISKILLELDLKIELNQKMNKTFQKMGLALFKHWFIDFEFPDQNRNPYSSSEGIMIYNEELEKNIPREWELKTINDVVTISGGSTPNTKKQEYWKNGKINWCTPKDLSKLTSPILLDTARKITESGLSSIGSKLLPVGTVLFSSRAPIGYLTISEIPTAVNQGFIAMECNKLLSKYFMLFWLQHNMDKIKSRSHGTTFQEINKTSFRKISILYPTIEILNKFDKLIASLYNKSVKNYREMTTLSTLRDSLLTKLMLGEIRVPAETRK